MRKFLIIIIAAIIAVLVFYLVMYCIRPEQRPLPSGFEKTCVVDSDCVVFGEDGDCNCGCFNKDYSWEKEGDCFCAAPKFCKCVDGKCEGVFEEINL